jgi:hypothetical protein
LLLSQRKLFWRPDFLTLLIVKDKRSGTIVEFGESFLGAAAVDTVKMIEIVNQQEEGKETKEDVMLCQDREVSCQ